MRRHLALLSLSLLPLGAAADALMDRARALGLAEDPGWRRLLHYRGGRSQADGPDFFLAKRGAKDPAAELEADLDAFAQPAPADPELQSAQCRFPARYAWLRERLGDQPDFPAPQPCPRLDKWLASLKPAGLTLVYASAYLNNPASMYGHSFLRIEPKGDRAAIPLLAYTINFAAETTDTNGLVFAVKGLLGGYKGKFSTHPYYMKVQQYTNMESRDLWEYRLNISSDVTRRLTLHLWELGVTWFDYYFLTENCSYQLFPLLEAVEPSLRLSDQFRFKAIPMDTIRAAVAWPGLAEEPAPRLSAVRTLLARRALLTPGEVRLAERAAGDPAAADAALAALPEERRALVLDSAHDLVRLRHRFARYPTPAQDAAERAILARRGRVPVPSPDVTAAAAGGMVPPEAGHRTGRIGLGGGRSAGRDFSELSLRGAMHDLEDDPTGFLPGSKLEMFHLRLRRFQGGPVRVHRATAVDILSLSPRDRWIKRPSWKIFIGWDTPLDHATADGGGGAARIHGGSGMAWGTERMMVFAMAGLDASAGGVFGRGFRTGWEGEAGAWTALGPARWRAAAVRRRYFWGDLSTVDGVEGSASLSLGKRWEARATFTRAGRRREARGMLHFYL